MPQSRLLLLPAEVRTIIYRMLFEEQRVTIHRPAHSTRQYPGAILHTCRLCYTESLPIFYELATIKLKQDAFLYVLGRRIGTQNMARMRNVVVAGFDTTVGGAMALHLPDSLKRLFIEWKGSTRFYTTTPPGRLSDQDIRKLLDQSRRDLLDSSVKELWKRIPKLQIYLDAVLGNGPEGKEQDPPWKRRYITVRVELVKEREGDEWSWGSIQRKVDRSMIVGSPPANAPPY